MKGTVYQIRPNKWIGAVDAGKDAEGKRIRLTTKTFHYKEDAEKALTDLKYELQHELTLPGSKEMLIPFLWNYYGYNEKRWAETTRSLYKMYIESHFDPYFKHAKLGAIKPITLDCFYKDRMANYRITSIITNGKETTRENPPITVNTAIKLNKFLKAAFNYAVKNKLITSNPADSVLLGSKEAYVPTLPTKEEFSTLMNAVKDTNDEIPILLAAGCGLRRSEVFGLTWEDIDLCAGVISINKAKVDFNGIVTKSPKSRTSARKILMPLFVIDRLSIFKGTSRAGQCDAVIPMWQPKAYSEHFKNLTKKYGIKGVRFHDLRHYHATLMMDLGIPDKVAAARLGHADVKTLRDIYQHVTGDIDSRAADEIDLSLTRNIGDGDKEGNVISFNARKRKKVM